MHIARGIFMEITHLRYFKKTAELEHITKAAQELHVAQPSLSRTISMLEDELKVKLFNRKGKSIELNEYGIIVLNHTNRILKELEAIHREIDDARENSVMNVTFSMNAASTLIPRLVRGFKEEHSDIRLHILQEDLVEDSGQSCDLTLFAGSQPVSGPYCTTLIEEEIRLALPVTNPLAHFDSLTLDQVSKEEFICLQKGKNLRSITDAYCKMAGFDPNVILESDSPETVRELIRAGIGISFIPILTWQDMEDEHIALVPISTPHCRRYINLSWRESSYLSPAAILFRDYLIKHFAELVK